MGKATAINTSGLFALASNAAERDSNRQADLTKLTQKIDPEGTHILLFSMIHNDRELRTTWLCKIRESMEPAQVHLDVSFDVFDEHTFQIESTIAEA